MCTASKSDRVLVPVGESVTLNCSSIEPVDWFYQRSENSSVQQISSAGVMVNGFEADGRYSLTRTNPLDKSFVIKNITVQESGLYTCRDTEHRFLRILRLKVSGTVLIIPNIILYYCLNFKSILYFVSFVSLCCYYSKCLFTKINYLLLL